MTAQDIKVLLTKLGSRRVIEFEEWIMGSCPFAPYTHTKKTDRRPSFGIRKGSDSIYHCFSCSSAGKLATLPSSLEFISNKSYQAIREFIQSATPVLQKGESFDSPIHKTIKEIPLSVYHSYPVMKEWNGLTKEDIKKWDLRYDPEFNRILYPIYNSNKVLIGIRGRSLTEKLFVSYTYLVPNSLDPKAGGFWFGMVNPLVSGKYLVLVEGERDAILLKRYATNVWSSMGVSVSARQIDTILNINNPLLVFFDNDQAGKEGIRRLVKRIPQGRCKVVKHYYGCKDPAEAVERNLISKILSSDNIITVSKEEING